MSGASETTVVSRLSTSGLARDTAARPDRCSGLFTARTSAHAGELLQLYGEQVAVASLPAPLYETFATVRTGVDRDRIPGGAFVGLQIAKEFMRALNVPDSFIELRIGSNVPIGKGCGSSTALYTAIADAVARAHGILLSDEELQALVFQKEGASDPLALMRSGDTVIYGTRNGRIVHRFPCPLPAMRVVLVDTDPGKKIDTQDCPGSEGATDLDRQEAPQALHLFVDGLVTNDLRKVGEAAVRSADLHQQRIPTRGWLELKGLARECKAAGLALAHSGTVVAFLFSPELPHRHVLFGELQRAVEALGCRFLDDYGLNGV